MPKKSTAQRILALLAKKGSMDAFDIKRELGVSRSTAYRNLKNLCDAGKVKWQLGRTVSGQPTKVWHATDYSNGGGGNAT